MIGHHAFEMLTAENARGGGGLLRAARLEKPAMGGAAFLARPSRRLETH